jgi:hypothetical protein
MGSFSGVWVCTQTGKVGMVFTAVCKNNDSVMSRHCLITCLGLSCFWPNWDSAKSMCLSPPSCIMSHCSHSQLSCCELSLSPTILLKMNLMTPSLNLFRNYSPNQIKPPASHTVFPVLRMTLMSYA